MSLNGIGSKKREKKWLPCKYFMQSGIFILYNIDFDFSFYLNKIILSIYKDKTRDAPC